MENKKIRCHFSIVVENTWKICLVLLIALMTNFRDVGEISRETGVVWGIFILALFLLFFVIFLFHFFRWRKTTVLLERDALIWERATLNRKSLTITIQNISSINLEQSLFERVIGTSRLKIDTNSLSTAKKTDLNLLFKKEMAENIKRWLEVQMKREKNGGNTEIRESENDDRHLEEETVTVQYTSSMSDLVLHSFYDLSLTGIFLAICVLTGFLGSLLELMQDIQITGTTSIFWTTAAIIFFGVSAMLSILKRFLTYYNFTVGRAGERIILSYGLLKKREYSLPVETINALTIKQTLMGRIFGRYNASIECIGVGDEDNETAQLTLSLPYQEMLRRVEELIPEYELDGLDQKRLVPRKALWHKLCSNIYLMIVAVLVLIVLRVFMKNGGESLLLGGFVVCLMINLIRIFLSMRTESFGMGKNFVVLTKGSFGKITTILQYHKIQYLEYTSSPVTHWTGLYKGNVHILSKTSSLDGPMVTRDEIEQMKRKCLKIYNKIETR